MEHEPAVVVTGVGIAVPLGLSLANVWARSLRGESAIAALRRFDAKGYACRASAEVPELELAPTLRIPKNEKFMGRSVRLAMFAAKAAVAQSGVDLSAMDPYRVAVYTGSGQTGVETAEFFAAFELAESGDEERDCANLGGRASRLIDRYWSLRTLANAGVGLISVELGARGASQNFVQGDTASALAVGSAVQDLVEGRSDVAVAGGYDSLLTISSYLAYDKAGVLSSADPERAYRPFDRDRDGIVLGEGAAFLVLEREADARRRSGPVLGEIVGVGSTMETGETLEAKVNDAALRAAAEQALSGRSVDLVVAHGIGTADGDRAEARILEAVFGEGPPVTAFKSQTGYLGAATGAVELALTLQALREGLVPPIARHQAPDDGCRLSLASGAARKLNTGSATALCLSWSWCGQCAAVAVRAPRSRS